MSGAEAVVGALPPEPRCRPGPGAQSVPAGPVPSACCSELTGKEEPEVVFMCFLSHWAALASSHTATVLSVSALGTGPRTLTSGQSQDAYLPGTLHCGVPPRPLP